MSVMVSGPGHDKIALTKDKESGTFALADIPKGKEPVDSEINGLTGALGYLSIAGVADPKLSDAELGFDKAINYVSTRNNGMVYTVSVGGKAPDTDGRLIRVKSDYVSKLEAPEKPAADADEKVKAAYNNQLATIEAEKARLTKESADFNAKHGPWTYTIASFKADALLKKRDVLFKDPEPEQKDETTSPAAPVPAP